MRTLSRSSRVVILAIVSSCVSVGGRAVALDLYAPFVRFESGESARLSLSDESGQGSLVRIHLIDMDGERITYGGHPVTISRAVPPGEALEVDLARFWSHAFAGSLRLDCRGRVAARLSLPSAGYELGEASAAGEQRFTRQGGAPDAELLVAVVNATDDAESEIEIQRAPSDGGDRRSLSTSKLSPRAALHARVSASLAPDDDVLLTSSTAIAAILLERPPSAKDGRWSLIRRSR